MREPDCIRTIHCKHSFVELILTSHFHSSPTLDQPINSILMRFSSAAAAAVLALATTASASTQSLIWKRDNTF
jgi:hypothetical protein